MLKNDIKYYSSLLKKKSRDQEKKFLIEGIKTIREALNSPEWANRCDVIFATNHFVDENSLFAGQISNKYKLEKVKESELQKLTDTVTPQGIAAVFRMPERKKGYQPTSKIVVALENISDPGNLGTILRNCDWFGIKEIIISSGSAELYSPKTIRSSMGSIFHLDIYDGISFSQYLGSCKENGYKIITADLEGKNIFLYGTKEKLLVAFANEANGPTQTLLGWSDEKITIPKLGNAESLNVASASAVIISQLTK